MTATCATCRFWNTNPYNRKTIRGGCRRFPPHPKSADNEAVLPGGRAFPLTNDEDWCGEHQPRETEPEKPKEREPGWYWVEHDGRSIIAEWCHWDNFRITGSRREFCEGWRIDGTEYVKEAARQISPRLEPPV